MLIRHHCSLGLILYLIKMKRIVFLFMFICVASFAQNSINNYKYIIVPSKFDFLKQADKYQTSSLTHFLLKKKGFVAFLDNEDLPVAIKQNRCLTLDANIKDASSMFLTKVTLEIKDCNRNVVFTSGEGTSRAKDFKKGYQEAIRNAFKSLRYTYQPIKKQNIKEVAYEPVVTQGNINNQESGATVIKRDTSNSLLPLLQAKAIKEGFVLVNKKNEPVFGLLETKLDKVFVIKNKNGLLYKSNKKGWIAEYYDVYGAKVLKNYNINFTSNN